jgi:hypothetical protein
VTYASPKGGRVPAYVVAPEGRGPFAGLILQHGLPGSRDDVLATAQELARTGAVVVAISAPFARPGHPGRLPVTLTPRDRFEQIQLIVDLRRAVDLLLARRDVDPHRIAYVGWSYGAAMGGLLAGVEHRVAAYVLAVGDGGLVEHFRNPAQSPVWSLPRARRRRWLAAMEPIEPLRYVGHARPASLYFQSGTRDDVVPPAAARRYQRAGSTPKKISWYRSGHHLPVAAECDQARWLEARVGIDATKALACR